jgi:4-alpha-glucanotransferase
MTETDLATLALARGIGDSYLDFRGQPREVSLRTRVAILAAMGIDVDDADAVATALAAPSGAPGARRAAASRCHEPGFLAEGARPWGLCAQLYTLRSATNWGVGDFADLARLARAAAARGADFLGLNPLHALFAADPSQCSPYSPSTRHCLNVLYIAIDAVPDLADCAEARATIAGPAFQQELARLRALDLVDYPGVSRCKLPVLRQLYGRFRRAELEAGTARAEAFRAYLAERADTVGRHALFEALDAHLRATEGASGGWPAWPGRFHDPDSAAVADFARESVQEVEFHAWLQWIAESQLAGAQRIAREAGMRIGLYGDYAVGSNPGGSETWSNRAAYCEGASIGAPPDALALKGQDWGLAPPDPWFMAQDDCCRFQQMMRDNMRHFGALRLDHVMALYRLWWVPRGLPASEGGYVHYPVERMFEAVAAESRRNACLVIGEDLGTVPAEVGQAMTDSGVYGYTVLYFERTADGGFRPPDDWRPDALASVTTHDLPSLRAWWEGSDIELRAELGMYPEGQDLGQLFAERERDRQRLVDAMATAGVRPRWPVERFEPDFAAAVHAFLASTASALVAVQAEDLLGMVDPVNVPGTSSEYANWRRKLSVDVEDLLEAGAAQPVLERLGRLRPR